MPGEEPIEKVSVEEPKKDNESSEESEYETEDESDKDGAGMGSGNKKFRPTPAIDAPPKEGNPVVFMDVNVAGRRF